MKTQTYMPVEFEMCGYKFRFGPSQIKRDTSTLAPLIDTFSLWRWNGYYWQIELADCPQGDVDSARHAMRYKIADERAAISKAKGAQ